MPNPDDPHIDPSPPAIQWRTAEASDAEMLAGIRVEAMRESLERVGRFDPARARDRFLNGFVPERTMIFSVADTPAGFYAMRRDERGLYLDHFYVTPGSQGRGLGAAVLARLFAMADREGLDMRLGALRQSDANRFYQRHGFVFEEEGEFDLYYVRRARQHTREDAVRVVR